MAEINVKSPQMKDRDVSTYRLVAEVNVGSCIACCAAESIDISGLTIANTGAATFTLSGFEAESDFALDSSRQAGMQIHAKGTAVGLSAAEAAGLSVTSAVVSGTAGSRIVTVTLATAASAGAVALSTTDSLENAVFEFILPIKAKDF